FVVIFGEERDAPTGVYNSGLPLIILDSQCRIGVVRSLTT
ncbi:hypothetical protein AC249_AIPGENE14318, partial [Exaiptasia diaphana]